MYFIEITTEFPKPILWLTRVFFKFSGHFKLDENINGNFLRVEIDQIAPSDQIDANAWSQPSRIQSMVLQDDGSIILCDGDSVSEIGDNIEVVEILSTGTQSSATPSQQPEPQPKLLPLQSDPVPSTKAQPQSHPPASTTTHKTVKKRPLHMQPKQVGQAQRFPCPRCGRDYSQRKNMRRHFRLECGQEPRFPCRICNLRFKRNNQMNSHMITRHGLKDASTYGGPVVYVDA